MPLLPQNQPLKYKSPAAIQTKGATGLFAFFNYRPSLRSVSMLIFAASNGVRSYH